MFAHELRDGMDVDLQMGRLVHLRFNLVLRVFKALWPAAGCQERLGRISAVKQIMQAVTGQPIKKILK